MEYKKMKETKILKKEIKSTRRLTKKVIFSLLLLMLSVALFLLSFYTKSTIILSYHEKSDVDYSVFLKENDYYETPSLEKDMQYVAALIDYIDVKFNYSFKADDKIDCSYKYYIEAYTKVCDKNNKENIIYKDSKILMEKTLKNEENSSDFNISEKLKIKYSDYNDLVRNFKSSYNINADSSLKLTLHIDLIGDYYKFAEPAKTKNFIELTIPLSEQMINIKMDQKNIDNTSQFEEISNKKLLNTIFLAASGMITLLFLIYTVNLLIYIKKIKGKKSVYQKKVDNILREYDRAIVELKEAMPTYYSRQAFIDVTTFEELLDASDKLGIPILFVEREKNKVAWFIVKHDEDIYRYIMNAENL